MGCWKRLQMLLLSWEFLVKCLTKRRAKRDLYLEQQRSNLFPSKPHILTPSSKSSTCWPGAMVQDQRGYLTPQSQRGRYGLHNFPRTPYSRTVYSRTKPKLNQLQADSRSSDISLTTFQQSLTPNYGQMKSSGDVMDGGYGSVGPIRRVRNKFTSEPRLEGPSSLFSAQIASLFENHILCIISTHKYNA